MTLFKPDIQKMQKAKNVDGLIKALAGKDPTIRGDACRALRIIKDPRAVPPLITALNDPQENVRREAVWALDALCDPRSADPLFAVLTDRAVFPAAANALAKQKDQRLYEILVESLADLELRSSAIDALGELGDPRSGLTLVSFLKDETVDTRKAAIYAIFRLKSAAGGKGLEQHRGEIQASLKDPDGYVRRWAMQILADIPDGLDREALIELLRDPDLDVRQGAAYIINRFELPKDPETLAWYAAGSRKWDLALELGQVSCEPLYLAIQTRDIDDRVKAAAALAALGDRRAIEPLLECLHQALARPPVAVKAIEALGKFGDFRAVKPLQGLFSDFYTVEVRRAAFHALSEMQARATKEHFRQPFCSVCGKLIPAMGTTIADDIRARGGVVVGGTGLDETLYDGLICRNCGKIYCSNCEQARAKNHICPSCSSSLTPLFADYLR